MVQKFVKAYQSGGEVAIRGNRPNRPSWLTTGATSAKGRKQGTVALRGYLRIFCSPHGGQNTLRYPMGGLVGSKRSAASVLTTSARHGRHGEVVGTEGVLHVSFAVSIRFCPNWILDDSSFYGECYVNRSLFILEPVRQTRVDWGKP
jgi:hypothetical protein